jgi:hypothetical protein
MLCLLAWGGSALAASFTNLNFESADLPFIPRGQFGDYQPIELALPGWRAFAGTEILPLILHNNATLGTAAISILGPDYSDFTMEGDFLISLRPGAFGFPGVSVDVSVEQTGLVPSDARSLQFLGLTAGILPVTERFGVFVNGQETDAFVLASHPNFVNTFGVDMSAFAGQEVTLRITSFVLPTEPNGLGLDALTFSPVAVPEPGAWALLGLGLVALAYRLKRQSH